MVSDGSFHCITPICTCIPLRRDIQNMSIPFFETLSKRLTKEITTGCLIYDINSTNHGQPTIYVKERRYQVNRIIYRLCIGELYSNQKIKRTCRNQRCVEPSHMRVIAKKPSNYLLPPDKRPRVGRPRKNSKPIAPDMSLAVK